MNRRRLIKSLQTASAAPLAFDGLAYLRLWDDLDEPG